MEHSHALTVFVNVVLFWCKPVAIERFVDTIIFNVKTISDCIREYIEIKLFGYAKQECEYSNLSVHVQLCERKINDAIDKTIQEFLLLEPTSKKSKPKSLDIIDQFEVNKFSLGT